MWKRIITIVGALVIVGGFITGGWILDDRYAKADDLKQNRIEDKIDQVKNDIRWYQDQMSYIMQRCGLRDPGKLPQYAYKNYNDYKIKKDTLDNELTTLMGKRNKF